MPVVASIASNIANGIGLLAGMIAVTGFLAHARPVLAGDPEEEIRQSMVRGGVIGFAVGSIVIVLSALIG